MRVRNFREHRETLPATVEAIEAFIDEVRPSCLRLGDETSAFAAELLLRETLVNAVAHGTRNGADGTVRCVLRLRGNALTICVEDQGGGFDWRAARERESRSSDPSGRGLEILRRYATRVRFNHKGNSVTILKRM